MFVFLGNLGVGNSEMGQKNFESDNEQKSPAKELPEYLKQKLRNRGILKDDSSKSNLVSFCYGNNLPLPTLLASLSPHC